MNRAPFWTTSVQNVRFGEAGLGTYAIGCHTRAEAEEEYYRLEYGIGVPATVRIVDPSHDRRSEPDDDDEPAPARRPIAARVPVPPAQGSLL